MAHGIESYIWRAMDVHGTCSVAKKYDGQTIRCDQAPKEGHVGEGECGSPDYCRCTKIPVIPGSLDLFMMMMSPEVFGFSSSKERGAKRTRSIRLVLLRHHVQSRRRNFSFKFLDATVPSISYWEAPSVYLSRSIDPDAFRAWDDRSELGISQRKCGTAPLSEELCH
jgi:hypothetical protein